MTDMGLAKYKAKREAWLDGERLKLDRERLDLERERLEKDLGRPLQTKRASREFPRVLQVY